MYYIIYIIIYIRLICSVSASFVRIDGVGKQGK
jgi:hypothetical protein